MWLSLRNEAIKIYQRKRSYLAFGAFLLLLILMYLGMTYSRKPYLVRMTSEAGLRLADFMDGMFFAAMAILPTLNLLYPVFVSLMAGDMIAGEAQEGTLRTLLARPVARWRVLTAKLLAMQVYLGVLCLSFAGMSLLVGSVCFGAPGDLLLPEAFFDLGAGLRIVPAREAMWKLVAAYLYAGAAGMVLASLGLAVSVLSNNAASAVITTLVIYFIAHILGNIPPLREFRPFLFSTHLEAWKLLFFDPVPWNNLIRSGTMALAFTATFFILSLLFFVRKDIHQ